MQEIVAAYKVCYLLNTSPSRLNFRLEQGLPIGHCEKNRNGRIRHYVSRRKLETFLGIEISDGAWGKICKGEQPSLRGE